MPPRRRVGGSPSCSPTKDGGSLASPEEGKEAEAPTDRAQQSEQKDEQPSPQAPAQE